jgi:fatty-acyl-CoA synthase
MTERYFSNLKQRCVDAPDDIFFNFIHSRENEVAVSFRTFFDRIQAAAHYFREHSVAQGDVVLIFAQHSPVMLQSFFAAQLIGAVPAFMPPTTAKQDSKSWHDSHKMLVNRIKPQLIISEPEYLEQVQAMSGMDIVSTSTIEVLPLPSEQILPVAKEDDIAFLQHSSGTTGLKKGVTVTYCQLLDQVAEYSKALNINRQTNIVTWLPVYHDMGLIAATLLPFTLGIQVQTINTFYWLSNPICLLEVLEKTPKSISWMPNFAFSYLAQRGEKLKNKFDLSQVDKIINCSEPCKAESMDIFKKVFQSHSLPDHTIQVCYAMAEYVFAVTQTPALSNPLILTVDVDALEIQNKAVVTQERANIKTRQIVSVGKLIGSTDVKISNAHQDGDIGEICVQGTSLCKGYYKNTDLSNNKFKDGWYHTGDFGFFMNEELFVTGRADDVIIIRGRNCYAHDFEALIANISGIKPGRVVAFGLEDSNSGTQQLVIAAELISEDDFNAALAIREAIYTNFSVSPIDVVILKSDTLIKTSSGKISRSENAKIYKQGKLTSFNKG